MDEAKNGKVEYYQQMPDDSGDLYHRVKAEIEGKKIAFSKAKEAAIGEDGSTLKKEAKKPVLALAIVFIIIAAFVLSFIWELLGSDLRIKIVANSRLISDQTALEKIADEVWENRLVRSNIEKNSTGTYELTVTVSYGGKYASGTVDDEKMKRTDILAKGALKMFRAGQKRKLTKLIMILKTALAADDGSAFQTYAYQAILSLDQVKGIPNWENAELDNMTAGKIREIWMVEFDEFNNMRIKYR